MKYPFCVTLLTSGGNVMQLPFQDISFKLIDVDQKSNKYIKGWKGKRQFKNIIT